jgi:hypothetical protein
MQRTILCIVWLFLTIFSSSASIPDEINAELPDSNSYSGELKDSVSKSINQFFIATSFVINKNWKDNTNSNFLLSGNFKFSTARNSQLKRITEVQTELAYIKFIDSIWVKNNDRLFISNIWILERKKFNQTISASFTTQITDTWIPSSNSLSPDRKWKSGPLLPASFLISYGIIYRPMPLNFINLSFPAYKIGSLPVNGKVNEELKILSHEKRYVLFNEYGISLKMNIESKIFKRISIENYTLLFIGIGSQTIYNLDMSSILSYSPLKNFKLQFENKLFFDEKFSDKMQVKYDMLLGLNVSF